MILTQTIELIRMRCPFCSLPPKRIVAANQASWVVRDGYPDSPGHTLFLSAMHHTLFDLGAFILASTTLRVFVREFALSSARDHADRGPSLTTYCVREAGKWHQSRA